MSLLYDSKKDIQISRDRLDYLPEPESMGRFHRPYSFAEYVGDIHNALDRHGVVVSDEQYVVQKDYQRLFGMMVVGEQDGWQLTLGIRGSHDQSVPRGIALGSNVLVCSNLCFSGELFTGKAKQTIHNAGKILEMIDAAMETIPDAMDTQAAIFDRYKVTNLTDGDTSIADRLMTEAFRRGALSGSQLGKAIHEYDHPSYPEHAQYGDVWKLFNAFTQAIKPTGDGVDMNGVVRKTQIITKLLNEVI